MNRRVVIPDDLLCESWVNRNFDKGRCQAAGAVGKRPSEHQYSKANPHGKMTVKQLAAKDKGLQSIEVTDQNIGSFNRIARKYGIDFAPFKVKGEKRYMVFFKAPDADAMTAAFKEYTAKQVRKAERPSVLEKLQHVQVAHSGGCGGQDKAEGAGTMKQAQRQKAHASQYSVCVHRTAGHQGQRGGAAGSRFGRFARSC